MRCRECDYPLWNLSTRACPECGTPFKPSDYEFVAATVQFCCPHCRQVYFGQGTLGHLEPRAFSCVKCHAEIDMDETVVRPAEGLTEADTRPGVVPWLERRTRGAVKAFLATIGLAMVRPGALMRGVPQRAPQGDALAFGFLALMPAVVVGGAMPWVGYWGWSFALGGGMGAEFWGVFWFLFLSVVAMFMVAGLIPLMGLATHAVLRMGGRPRYSLDRTIQALGYSAGAGAACAVPCVGPLLGWLWWMVSAVAMVRTGQRVSRGRAATAVFAFPVIMLAFIAGLAGLFTWWSSSFFGGGGFAGGAAWTTQNQFTYALNNSLQQYAWQNSRTGPEHALELVLVGNLAAWGWGGAPGAAFCQPGTKTTPADIPLGDTTLKDFLAMSMTAKLGAAKTLLESMPDGVVAHRVGDFVFTYHGLTLNGGDPQLWVVVMLPDPDVNGTPAPQDPVHIGTDSYAVTEITYGELAAELKAQNAYRQTLGLAPLPDLLTVTHAQPAVAPAASGGQESQESP